MFLEQIENVVGPLFLTAQGIWKSWLLVLRKHRVDDGNRGDLAWLLLEAVDARGPSSEKTTGEISTASPSVWLHT